MACVLYDLGGFAVIFGGFSGCRFLGGWGVWGVAFFSFDDLNSHWFARFFMPGLGGVLSVRLVFSDLRLGC